jgi:glycosyltransferase involved in cell wall biosynthesis
MNREPFVSVVVTTYNQAPYLAAAIDSVLDQSYRHQEVIVVDDGSIDTTPQVLDRFRGKIIAVRQANQGVAAARNSGVRHARGEFVALLDGDDLWEPDKLRVQVEAALENPQSGLIVADGVQFDGPRITRDSLIGAPVHRLMDPAAATTTLWGQRHFVNGNFVSTASQVMIPREVLKRIGPSDTSLALASDWDLYLRISLCYPITLIRQRLMSWRYLATSASGPGTLRALRWGEDDLKLLQKHLHVASPELRPLIRGSLRAKAFATAQAAYYSGLDGERAPARAVLRRLLLNRHVSVAAISFLLALYAPRALTAFLGPKMRVLLGSRSRTRG